MRWALPTTITSAGGTVAEVDAVNLGLRRMLLLTDDERPATGSDTIGAASGRYGKENFATMALNNRCIVGAM